VLQAVAAGDAAAAAAAMDDHLKVVEGWQVTLEPQEAAAASSTKEQTG
jgi:DNA-binding GntR family transcriptional regulator